VAYSIPVRFDKSHFLQTPLTPTPSASKPCGHAVVLCIALPGNPVAKPIRCGKLTGAPVCRSGSEEECHSFCDQDRSVCGQPVIELCHKFTDWSISLREITVVTNFARLHFHFVAHKDTMDA
jgi:hypothetical protein